MHQLGKLAPVNANQPPISVIVPVGPGETAWPDLLERLTPLAGRAEVVLSAVESLELPDSISAATRLVCGPAGRATQLNRGVRAAGGAWLWLLHADSRPTPQVIDTVLKKVLRKTPKPTIGWCALDFADGPRLARLNAVGANLRSHLFGLPFGDQGWLLERSVFDRLGGFDEDFGRGEDLEFILRARAAGIGTTALGCRLSSSARRYRKQGWLRTTIEHLRLTLRLRRRSLQRLAAGDERREHGA